MLHFAWVGAPSPISPFLPLLLFDGVVSFNHDAAFLGQFLSPAANLSLNEWVASNPDTARATASNPSSASGALFAYADANVRSP